MRGGATTPRAREPRSRTRLAYSRGVADLSITAVYTSQLWAWANLPCAELCATPEGKRVFDVTNAALALARKQPVKYLVLQRHAMITHLLRASGLRHVLEVAAGLSPRGAELSTELAYTEVDLPAMMARKRELLARTAAGRAVLGRLRLVDGDLATMSLAPLVSPAPTFVIAEGLCMYLRRPERVALFRKVRELAAIAGEVRFAFDLVPAAEEPAPGLTGRALAAAMKLFTGGGAFERDARTRADVLGELREAGFAEPEAIAAHDVARAWHLPHADQVTPVVVFSAAARATRA